MEDAIRAQLGDTSPGDPAAPRVRRSRRGGETRAASDKGNAASRTTSATQGGPGSAGGTPPASPKSPPRVTRGRNDTQLRNDLAQYISAVSLIPMTFGDIYSAQVISTRAEYLAEAYTDLAKQNPKVRKALEAMMSGGAWGGAIVATASVLIPIAGHHGLIPAFDPWQAMMPVEAPQVPAREPQRDRTFTGNRDGVVTVSPDMAAAFAATMNDTPTPDFGAMDDFASTLSGMPEAVDRVASSGAGTDSPENYTPPVAPGQPAGVVTVAGVQAMREATLSQMPEEVTAAPNGRATDAPPPVPQAPNRRSDIAASAAPSAGDGTVKPRRSRNRARS